MFEEINTYNIARLKEIAVKINIDPNQTKKELAQKIINLLKKEHTQQHKSASKYKKKEQLGEKGKEGRTFLVTDKFDCEYAMKTFRSNKSPEKIEEEVNLQRRCSEKRISPKIIDFDLKNKYIVMEKMDYHLTDELTGNNGLLSVSRQKELIDIFNKLDKAQVFHGDANLLNYMVKNNKLYIIDFGMSKEITPALEKKLETTKPNYQLMLLGFILKLKDMNCPNDSYSLLKTHLSESTLKNYKI